MQDQRVARPRMRRIGGKHPRSQVTGVGHLRTGPAQPVRQPRGAQRPWAALQTAVVRVSAAGDPDHR